MTPRAYENPQVTSTNPGPGSPSTAVGNVALDQAQGTVPDLASETFCWNFYVESMPPLPGPGIAGKHRRGGCHLVGPTFISAWQLGLPGPGPAHEPHVAQLSLPPSRLRGPLRSAPSPQGKGCSMPGGALVQGSRRECRREEGMRAH